MGFKKYNFQELTASIQANLDASNIPNAIRDTCRMIETPIETIPNAKQAPRGQDPLDLYLQSLYNTDLQTITIPLHNGLVSVDVSGVHLTPLDSFLAAKRAHRQPRGAAAKQRLTAKTLDLSSLTSTPMKRPLAYVGEDTMDDSHGNEYPSAKKLKRGSQNANLYLLNDSPFALHTPSQPGRAAASTPFATTPFFMKKMHISGGELHTPNANNGLPGMIKPKNILKMLDSSLIHSSDFIDDSMLINEYTQQYAGHTQGSILVNTPLTHRKRTDLTKMLEISADELERAKKDDM
ncbi:hypothetical protein BABINDRAFT_92412 [Babjeviella inositovora NRRL Y-12698]|uniref:Uncharacterized protein n=1 Tax=Babjeviella inositovora NRRL Y-12698 TaxID=984486 RepID=A0A1E3QK77_9ASCO|nr:uncharacterized protein BABINDRAFT_92412 [Babjeviella inositovora NRRL Y-12698]ODQ78085.1 hypothetical protein BABINDRAFT_92412 [Babjeviella inositovora NRRL Y-12698]